MSTYNMIFVPDLPLVHYTAQRSRADLNQIFTKQMPATKAGKNRL